MPQMPPSKPFIVQYGGAAAEARGPLPDGTSVDILGFPVGSVAVPPSDNHIASFHLGAPIKASCRCDGRTYRRYQQEGDMDFLPAGMPGYWEDESPARALVVRIPATVMSRTLRSMGQDRRRLLLEPRFQIKDQQLNHIFQAIRSEIEAGRPGGLILLGSLCTALTARLIALFAVAGVGNAAVAELTVRRRRQILSYIDERLDEDLSLQRLAAVAGMSESHFKTLFRNTFGKPAHQFVMERRVERARHLLAGTDLPIAQVALEAGFSHQSHLARWVRRSLGTTPAVIRQRSRDESGASGIDPDGEVKGSGVSAVA